MAVPSTPRTPRLSRTLLRLAAPAVARADVLGDHDVEFARVAHARGIAAARRWSYWQAARSSAPLLWMRVRHAALSTVSPGWLDDAAQAWRALTRHPRIAIVCVTTLAVALSATLAATSILERAVLHPLPFPDAGRIVRLWSTGPDMADVRSTGLLDVDDWRAASRTMAAISAYTAQSATLTGRGEARQLDAMRVGRDFDRVLGVRAAHGRLFDPSEFIRGNERALILTDGFWRREFGGDPTVVGRTLTLDDEPWRIVGVLEPMSVVYPAPKYDVWMPLIARENAFWERARETGWVTAVGRLGPATTLEQAGQELSAIAKRLAAQYPKSNGRRQGVGLNRVEDDITETSGPVLFLITGAIGAVLVVAIGNLINLLLAHGERRRREFAVRLALGANPARLRRQTGLESLIVTVAASSLALAAAPSLVSGFRSLYPADLPGAAASSMTPPQLWVALAGVAVSTMLLAWPQRRFTRVASRDGALRASQRGTVAGHGRGALIAAQSALSVVLLVLAIVFIRTLSGLAAITPGFDPHGVLVFGLTPSPSKFGSAAAAGQFYDDVLTAVRAVPGVKSAGFGIGVPFVSAGWGFGVTRPGSSAPAILVGVNAISSGYLETLRMPLVSGRFPTDDELRGESTILINEAAVKLMPNPGPAIGQRVPYSGRTWEVVGVIGDVREGRLDREGRPWLVLPWKQAGSRPQTMVVRTDGDPLAMVPSIAAVIHQLDDAAPLAGLRRLSDVVDESVAAQRFRAIVVSALGVVAAWLAAIGVYSVTAFAVARQERENGVRLALGESTAALSRRVVISAVVPAAIGAVAGLGVAWAAARWVQTLLYNTDVRDPLTLAAAAAALVAIAVLAAMPSARRAARIDPTIALRAD
ncbi:MAG TPA: ADOP family duplicated permease [Vicinamibacterales bacterium]|nr:ADOP family duplicated permease [Vicinamibacterales bacterium]